MMSEKHTEAPAFRSPLLVTTVQPIDTVSKKQERGAHHSRSQNPPRLLFQTTRSKLKRSFECWTALRLCRAQGAEAMEA